MIKETLGGKTIEYPEWCKIIASKTLDNGNRADFPAIEYWKENYANKGKDSAEPNAMWSKRPRAQLAKCTEAQALRRAFPDILGSNVTFEEMEDKVNIKDVYGSVTSKRDLTKDETTPISPEQLEILENKLIESDSDIPVFCKHYSIESLSEAKVSQFSGMLFAIDKKIKKNIQANAMKELANNKSTPEIDEFFEELGNVDTETGEVVQ